MSGRPTADIVIIIERRAGMFNDPELSEAATRLIELDKEVRKLTGELGLSREMHLALLDELDDLRPPCRACGGTQKGAEGMNVEGQKSWAHCTNCIDGKTPIAQLVAEHNALWNDDNWRDLTTFDAAAHAVIYALRHVEVPK